jgi:hypothetical protein
MGDNSYAIALLWAWLAEHPEHYCSWVNPYTQLRWCPKEKKTIATRVGGHWRRLSEYARLVPALNCVCKFERIARPRFLGTPMRAVREARDGEGNLIPRKYRVLVWA